MARRRWDLRVDAVLAGRVDAAASVAGLSRTGWVEWALEAALRGGADSQSVAAEGLARVPASEPAAASPRAPGSEVPVVGELLARRRAVLSGVAKRGVGPVDRGSG